MNLHKMNLVLEDNSKTASRSRTMPLRWHISDSNGRFRLVRALDNERTAKHVLAELQAALQYSDTVAFLGVLAKVAQLRLGQITDATRMLIKLYDANRTQPQGATTGRLSGVHVHQGNIPKRQFQATLDPRTQAICAATDPKSKAFINVAKDLGYEVQDLYEMDEKLKEKIADVVDYEFEQVRTEDPVERAQGRPKTFAQPYGTPVIPSSEKVEKPDTVELDRWDLLAGHTKTRDPLGEPKAKKPYEPDAIRNDIDPMEEIRRIGGRGGY